MMNKPYMLTYDLKTPGQNYKDVINTIRNEIANGYCKYWDSTCLLRTSLTPIQMMDKLKPYLDRNDSLFVTEIINNKSGWLTESQWDFINKNIYD